MSQQAITAQGCNLASAVHSCARLACFATLLQACAAASSDATPATPYASWPDPLTAMSHGAEQRAQLCSRAGDDPVRDLFCAASPPVLTGLDDLQAALQLDSASVTGVAALNTGHGTALSVTAHSTALAARSVSAINPRLIAIRVDNGVLASFDQLQFTALAFARGEQFVELVVRNRSSHELELYLVSFRQACNSQRGGCTPGDLLTPAIERDWEEATLYDETDLSNTVLDCAPCHQPAGPGTAKVLRMQELNQPWTHWFSQNSDGGRALLADYIAAKGDEPLAGMSQQQIEAADPAVLTVLMLAVDPGMTPSFDSLNIEKEVQQSAAARGGNQPFDNAVAGDSPTWGAAYELSQRGGTLALPYHDVKVTDPAKLAQRSDAYRAYRSGELDPDDLPDLRDIFSDDWARRAELGVATTPGLDGRGVLMQACSLCHNERLDPTLSRARFRADLFGMTRAEKDAAIARLKLRSDHPLAMPPARLRVLSDKARAQAIDALQ